MKIAIDLTWLKPKKSGGVESYIRNLLDGFKKLEDKNHYYLMTAKDNELEFDNYFADKRFSQIKCNTHANKVKNHLLWQNFKQYRCLKKYDVDLIFFPVYEMPIYKNRKYKTAVVIHDIQAYHYPENFSKFENLWFRFAWKRCIKNANRVISITEYTKEDIKKEILNKDNIVSIHNPIVLNDTSEETNILKKCNLKKDSYYYTVSSLHKHKNLLTLVDVMKEIKERNIKDIPNKLVISGISAGQKDEFIKIVDDYGLNNNIILTGFVSNAERNELIKNCNTFLFPSIFEGFGMPPVEAMILGARVITTKETSIPEVTRNEAFYVNNPFSADEWINMIKTVQKKKKDCYKFDEYSMETVAREYLNVFYDIHKSK